MSDEPCAHPLVTDGALTYRCTRYVGHEGPHHAQAATPLLAAVWPVDGGAWIANADLPVEVLRAYRRWFEDQQKMEAV